MCVCKCVFRRNECEVFVVVVMVIWAGRGDYDDMLLFAMAFSRMKIT